MYKQAYVNQSSDHRQHSIQFFVRTYIQEQRSISNWLVASNESKCCPLLLSHYIQYYYSASVCTWG